jgi:hypothetical protein
MVRRGLGSRLALFAGALACAVACRPELDERTSLLAEPRIVAVRSEPAEAAQGERVTFEALVVDASGSLSQAPVAWAFCTERKPLAELGPVSPRCFRDPGVLVPFGTGTMASGWIPSDACRRFGPEVAAPRPNESPARPVDADETGGFYQPVRIAVPHDGAELVGLERTRIDCGAGNASAEALAELRRRRRANTNPKVEAVLAVRSGAEERLVTDGDPHANTVFMGERLTLRVRWSICPSPGCTGREPYVMLDPRGGAVVDRVESIVVSWLATDGAFASDRSGPTGTDPSAAENVWTAPDHAGVVQAFVVLRDDRGGSGWASIRFEVRRPP